jgi:hypothetical protein
LSAERGTASCVAQAQELGEADEPADAAEKERQCPPFAVDEQLGGEWLTRSTMPAERSAALLFEVR